MVALALPTTTLLGEKRRLEMLNGGVVLPLPRHRRPGTQCKRGDGRNGRP